MKKAQGWAAERTSHLRRGDEEGLAATRENLKREYSEEGTLFPMLLVDAEDWGAPGLTTTASFQGEKELLRLSKN